MQLSLQNFSSLVANMSAAARASYGALLDVSAGSALRALLEAASSTALWLQYLILQVLSSTRLATSSGTDVDSWIADFGLSRLPATTASGVVTMTSLNPASQSAVVNNGATVRSADGTVSFSVINGPYTRASGTTSVDVEVQATTAGSIGNVAANTITLLCTAISGIDTVTNPVAFANGSDAETDMAVRDRFVNYINTRARATIQAVTTAVQSVKQGLTSIVIENRSVAGVDQPGHFTVVVDDGTGSPASDTLAAVASAVDAVRPLGSTFSVVGPEVVRADVDLTITLQAGGSFASVQSEIETAVSQFITSLAVGQALPFSRLAALAYGADATVINVVGSLNGGTSDLGGGAIQVVRLGNMNVSQAATS